MATEHCTFEGAETPVARALHWHVVGQRARPLHEQLAALRKAIVWTAITGQHQTSSSRCSPRNTRPNFAVACVVQDAYAVLVISGTFDASALVLIRQHLHGILRNGAACIVLDLQGLTSCDGRLSGLLAQVERRARAFGCEFVLANVPTEFVSEFDIGNLGASFVSRATAATPPPATEQASDGDVAGTVSRLDTAGPGAARPSSAAGRDRSR
ncbi:STAS domain-containing protein [Jatrophihabitans sp. DSM 45814]